jgi:hypothetical protein
VLGRVTLVYETYESGELSDSSGYLDGISMALAGTLAQRLTLLTLRRADGRTAVVTITEVLPETIEPACCSITSRSRNRSNGSYLVAFWLPPVSTVSVSG